MEETEPNAQTDQERVATILTAAVHLGMEKLDEDMKTLFVPSDNAFISACASLARLWALQIPILKTMKDTLAGIDNEAAKSINTDIARAVIINNAMLGFLGWDEANDMFSFLGVKEHLQYTRKRTEGVASKEGYAGNLAELNKILDKVRSKPR